ncbi:putative phage protein (TIGR02218 family) [Novosphingobium chloroacetimidivorans]|uniref:Putative phage protein (TIGR02218 family) n=1 Tax=Novosphingobium chloroacetimidivorans TaxID=1428314 RepID=A0A7W7NY31_9SPHN|nr:DUF2163 domain-containing protein [Novosphingobium chloroacetimidivorans]MBB4860044.1 putative phage protein (TIGR02218 family) [Novosphingobium chloroacetimidivorans]
MSRAWFARPLETVATYWRILRRDGVTLGFTSHDRDLWFEGVLHRASPGMVPSAVRRSAGLDEDSAEVAGALSHDAISAADLAAGRYDAARVRIGLIDWETGQHEPVWTGTLGTVSEEDGGFTAELVSRKADLLRSAVPRTSPACRAAFCGPGCNLSPAFFMHEASVTGSDRTTGSVTLACDTPVADLVGGTLQWLDGSGAGTTVLIRGADRHGAVVLDRLPEPLIPVGARALVREGCDHTLETCATRFGNAANFRGEPFLPGNDLLARYPSPLA